MKHNYATEVVMFFLCIKIKIRSDDLFDCWDVISIVIIGVYSDQSQP